MWHSTLVYTANSVLENTARSDWRFFYLLTIHCYSRMSLLYPFAESAVKSILGLAINAKAISTMEAKNLVDATIRRKEREPRQTAVIPTNVYATDLNLATSDLETAATVSLARRFEEISMYDEFTEGVCDTE